MELSTVSSETVMDDGSGASEASRLGRLACDSPCSHSILGV